LTVVGASRSDRTKQSLLSPLFYLFTANQRAHALLNRAMQDSPLTSEEYAAYSAIFEVDRITPTDFARTMGLPLTTALDHVRSMLKRRHIRKLRNPRDQRSYLIELTDAGLKAHRDARAHFAPADDRLIAILGSQRKQVSEALVVLMNAAERALDELEEDTTEATG
jgi:DNA-binding MarR family transcriptional regulator